MPETISINEFKLLRDLIEKWCGIALGLLAESGCADFGSFYRLIAHDPNPHLRDKIVDAMTTNETLWFRDTHPFQILREKFLPKLAEDLLAGNRFRIRIWSGASSTGQEPYSIAMSIHEFCNANPGVRPDQFEILATDISPSALMLAKLGRYDNASISRGLSENLRNRYFRQDGNVWVASDDLKRLVTLRKFNLQDSMEPLGRFDVVFMRYVTIYFSDAFKQQIYRGVASLLAPEGNLIISAVESLRGISDDFVQQSHAGGSYYRCSLT